MSRVLVWVCLVSLALAPGVVLAHGDHAVTGQGEVEGAGWVRLDGSDRDGHLQVSLTAHASAFPLALGMDVVNRTHDPLFFSIVYFEKEHDGRRLEVGRGDLEVLTVHDEQDEFFRIRATFTLHLRGFPLDDTRIVLWSAGPVSKTTWTLEAGQDATLEDVTTGTDTFLYSEDALEGPLEFESPELQLRGQALASQTVEVENVLVGAFLHGENAHDHMRAEGPDSTYRCPCIFGELGPEAPSPGSYEFQATGVGNGTDRWILLSGADVAGVAG